MFRPLSVLCILAALALAPPIGRPADGLLGHWRFDEAGGDYAEDASGNGNEAEVRHAQWVKGAFGSALRFDGKRSYVATPQLKGLDGSHELTVEAWVYWEGGGRYPNIITGGRWSPGGFLMFVRDSECTFRMGRPGASASQPGSGWRECSARLLKPFEPKRWYHLAATFKRPAIKTYVNGEDVATARWDYPVGYSQDVLIGRWGGGPSHLGLIDEVKIYNRALSPAEITASYRQEAPRRGPAEPAYAAVAPSEREWTAAARIDTAAARIEIDPRGQCFRILDKRTGRNVLAEPGPIAFLSREGRTVRRCRCSYESGRLTFRFGKGQATAVVAVRAKERYVVFEVVSLEGAGVDTFTFLSLRPGTTSHRHRTSGLSGDDEFGLCMRTLNLQTQVTHRGASGELQAVAHAKYGIVGSKAALVACPTRDLIPTLREVVEAERVPHSPLGGPWALDAEANRGSYLFAHVSEQNVDDWISLVRRAGFTHVHFSGWSQALGHYEPRRKSFPNGLEGMKAAVRKIHAAGLKAGMHTLTGCISTRDSWVRPVPDERLAADATYTLAAELSPTDTTIHTTDKPRRHDTVWTYSGGGNALRLGKEIVQYSAISYTPPYGFLNCTRGAFGTAAQAHAKAARVDHLLQRYLAFYPDENSTLVDEVADCIARVYNECGMEMIYMDGAEGMRGWHPVAKMRLAIFQRLRRPGIVEASSWGHHSWPFHSRIGAWDHPKWALKRFVDMHCEAVEEYRRAALLEAQLGWWALLGPSRDYRSEMPDEVEYLCAKALARDAAMSIQGTGARTRPANARMLEYMTTIGQYERLRLARYFAEPTLAKLREPGAEFRLSQTDAGEWQLAPTVYAEHKVTGLADRSAAWTFTNPHPGQPLRMRVEALYSAVPYDGPDALVVAAFDKQDEFQTRAAAGVSLAFAPSTERVKAGPASACLRAASKLPTRRGAWAVARKRFAEHLDLRRYDALGFWVHGDGKGEVLNVQLTNPSVYSKAWSDHYVDVDFKGWRYVELLLRERDSARHRDYVWPYRGQHAVYRTRLSRAHVSEINVYVNHLPAKEAVEVYLSPIRALRTTRVQLRSPAVTVAGKQMRFPVVLHSGHYMEFDGPQDCRVYDERGTLLDRIAVQGSPVVAAGGDCAVRFSCDPIEGFHARAQVTLITSGKPMSERAPRDQIAWDRLQWEYVRPRTVLATDGRQNRVPVVCRPHSKPVRLSMELSVLDVGLSGEAYRDPTAITLESFDKPGLMADGPENQYAKYVHDSEHRRMATKPGVTQKLSQRLGQAKAGPACGQYTATSTRSDNAGWSAKGRRYPAPLDLSACRSVGFWLHGDGKGESFKVQLRDTAGKWHDMVTRVSFAGWRYVEFDLAGAKLDLGRIEYLIIYYNSIPAGETVTCLVDDIRALRYAATLRRPVLTVGDARVVFPVDLARGDRLRFDAEGCSVTRKAAAGPVPVRAEGRLPQLRAGKNSVELTLGPGGPEQFRVMLLLAKRYE